jgi:16S rRNA A1518/A1519 N6-dimethyltransferase RsmA/KsgA/DIM1 with predicted DNA glycosylase/AP lyase activity
VVDIHFLVDEEIARRVVELADLSNGDVVFEVGAGEGFLTRIIAQKAHVVAVEKEEILDLKNLADDRVSVIFGDAMEEIMHFHFNKVICNPPFTLLESLFRILARIDFSCAVLIVPERFAQKVGKDFLFSSLYEIHPAFTIPPEKFHPPPKTNPLVLLIKKRDDEKSLFACALLASRAKVRNFIVRYFEGRGLTKREAREKLGELGIPGNILEKRSETLISPHMALVWERVSLST